MFQELPLSAQAREGIAVGHRLGEVDQIGRHAADLAVASHRVPEPGLHLVEDEHETVLVGQLPEPFQVSGDRLHDADVLQDGLGHQGGHLVALTDVADRIQVVEVDDMHQLGVSVGDPRSQRNVAVLPGRDARSDLVQRREDVAGHVVVGTVEAALHDDDVVAAGGGAGQAHGSHGGLGSRIEELHHLDGGDVGAEHLGQAALQLVGPAPVEAGAGVDGIADRLIHVGVVVAQHDGGEGRVVVQVAVVVHIPDVGPPARAKARSGSALRTMETTPPGM